MPTEIASNTDVFTQIIADEKAAATALAETLEQQNTIFLNFCNNLVGNILRSMGELNAMELAVAGNNAHQELTTAKNTATENIQPATTPSPTESSNVAPKNTAIPSADSSNNAIGSFVDAMNASMHNAVTAQQQMYIIAQASTTQAINIILSIATDTLAVAVHNKEQ